MRALFPGLLALALCACGGPEPEAAGGPQRLEEAPAPGCASRVRGTLRTSAGDVSLDGMRVDAAIATGAGGCVRGLALDVRVPNGSCALVLRLERGRAALAALDARSCPGMAVWTRGFYAAERGGRASFATAPGAPGCADAWTVTFAAEDLALARVDDGEPLALSLGDVVVEARLGGAAGPGDACEAEEEDEDED